MRFCVSGWLANRLSRMPPCPVVGRPVTPTPFHDHWWEHEVYILAGEGVVRSVDGDIPLKPEDAILVPGGEQHCFVNTGTSSLKFICCIPVASAQPPSPDLDAPVCDPVTLPTQ